jgi:hypothetical protein
MVRLKLLCEPKAITHDGEVAHGRHASGVANEVDRRNRSSVVTEIVAKLSMKFTTTQIGSGQPRGRQPSSPNTRRFDAAADDEGVGEPVDPDSVVSTVGAN